MTNKELLNTYPGYLNRIEQQARFLLKKNGEHRPCPNCGGLLNVYQAARVKLDDYDVMGNTEYPYHCPRCKRELLHVLPFMGEWIWALKPVSVEEAAPEPAPVG